MWSKLIYFSFIFGRVRDSVCWTEPETGCVGQNQRQCVLDRTRDRVCWTEPETVCVGQDQRQCVLDRTRDNVCWTEPETVWCCWDVGDKYNWTVETLKQQNKQRNKKFHCCVETKPNEVD